MHNVLSIFWQAFRQMRSRKGLWCAVVITLALGIGANTAVFSVVNRMLVQPLPFPDAKRLVMVYNTYPKNDLVFAGTSIPDYLDRKDGAPSFAGLAMFTKDFMSFNAGDAPERLLATRTTPSLFTVLKSRAALGRTLIDADALEGAAPVVVLSHRFWQRVYAGDSSVLGKDLKLSGRNYSIVGVMPAEFAFPDRDRELYVPMMFSAREKSDAERGNEYSTSIGRLKPGASIASANAEMKVLIDRIMARSPEAKAFYEASGFGGRAEFLQTFYVGELAGLLRLLQAATLLVLLIAVANVANLLLAQGLARRREFSVRAAIGAGRLQLFRQLMAEALLAAIAGATLGLLVAKACLMLMGAQLTQRTGGSLLQPALDAPVLLFTLVIAIVVALLVSLIPAFVVQRSVTLGLRDGGHGSTAGKLTQLSRASLVIMQLTLSVALLIGAGLLLRSFERLSAVDPGFRAEGLYSAAVVLGAQQYPEATQRANFYEATLRGIRAIPGVSNAGITIGLPFTPMASAGASFRIKGEVYDATRTPPHAFQRVIDAGYLDAAKVPLLMGRNFSASDRADSAPVVLIDKIFADKHFAGQNPIGKQVTRGDSRDPSTAWSTVIGVVGAVKSSDLSADVRKETLYAPLLQTPGDFVSIVIRSDLAAAVLSQNVRQVLQKIDPGLPLFDIQSMQSRISASLGPKRAPMQLLVVFAGVALLLAAVGTYAVLAFLVGQRSGEIGLRVAIGAVRGDILRMVLGHSVKLIGIGLVLGLGAAVLLARGLASQLFGVSPYDPSTYFAVLSLLAIIGLVASVIPAQRACSVDPLRALRGE
jgi:predicted permease